MVHEKYTKRGGKIYGPYLYENKRVNGKVVTEYLGKGSNFGVKYVGEPTTKDYSHGFKIALVVIGLIAVLGLLFVVYQNISPTGLPLLDVQIALILIGR